MRKINVLLAIRPRLLSDVVRGIVARQPDLAVVGEVRDLRTLLVTIRATEAAVVIITLPNSDRERGIGSSVLVGYPHLKIMVLSAHGDTAVLYAAGARQTRIDDVDEESLLHAIYHAWVKP
jgi:DNA-binding NarL/FixJ family response regulator